MPEISPLSFLIFHADGRTTALSGVPLTHPTVISFVADPAQTVNANRLSDAVCEFLLTAERNVQPCAPLCAHTAAGIPSCPQCSRPGAVQLLVAVFSDQAGPAPPGFIANLAWWTASQENRKVVPVFHQGAHPESVLPPELGLLNSAFWSDAAEEIVPVVLSAADVTPESHRIFISYRRLETEPLAEDLFETLNRLGFDVFLDRFAIPAAVNFQRRLHSDLAEKAMVLLLESDRFGESIWTTEEITYCKRYELGLYALRLPWGMGGPQAGTRKLPGVPDEWRDDLTIADFQNVPVTVNSNGSSFIQWGRLTASARDAVGAKIRARHDTAFLRRRQNMRSQMVAELAKRRAAAQTAGQAILPEFSERADGLLCVKSSKNTSYAVWVTPRPPEVHDFHATHAASQFPRDTVGVIVGLSSLLEPQVQARLAWLSGVCKLVLVDQGHIVSASRHIAEGTL